MNNKLLITTITVFATIFIFSCKKGVVVEENKIGTTPVDLVNPYMGNIQHMLMPTFPTVHLPNEMMRFYPDRENYTSTRMSIPLIQTSHRGEFAFHISPVNSITDSIPDIVTYSYDNESITPYSYNVYLEDSDCEVKFSPKEKSGIFEFDFNDNKKGSYLIINTSKGYINAQGRVVEGLQELQNNTKCYLYLETDKEPSNTKNKEIRENDSIQVRTTVLGFDDDVKKIKVRYGISYISVAQAKENLYSQIQTYEMKLTESAGKSAWNNALGKIKIEGGTLSQQKVFYTSLYRFYERMININENGKFFSAYDDSVHKSDDRFYVDDWVWDTYRATHPLRILIDPKVHHDILNSYIKMAEMSTPQWLPTFPEVTGDTHRMNGTHTVSLFADAACKNVGEIDYRKAYNLAKNTLKEKSYLPWTKHEKGELSKFMDKNGYFPALRFGEKETYQEVTKWEKRQSVAVTLAASFDYWSLIKLAKAIGNTKDIDQYDRYSKFYKNLFNEDTRFFHPKDKYGKFIEPFDYELSGGLGGRDYYDENNAYTYRFDLQQDPNELVKMFGGNEKFVSALDSLFSLPISDNRFNFLHQFPDHTGNVGQFSMANEPSLHIPYLYSYAGAPWLTQKYIRKLINEWFRDDLMGVPGDEDGGGMSAFVVFSMMGIYPVTPGLPYYVIGSPFFHKTTINLDRGKTFTIVAKNVSNENKYIQSARLNDKPLNRCYLKHSEIIEGGELIFEMSNKPNKNWGVCDIPRN